MQILTCGFIPPRLWKDKNKLINEVTNLLIPFTSQVQYGCLLYLLYLQVELSPEGTEPKSKHQ